jgi:hypothetical protein
VALILPFDWVPNLTGHEAMAGNQHSNRGGKKSRDKPTKEACSVRLVVRVTPLSREPYS